MQAYPINDIAWNTHLSSQDSAVVQDPEGEGQIVYLFLPLYKVCFVERPLL